MTAFWSMHVPSQYSQKAKVTGVPLDEVDRFMSIFDISFDYVEGMLDRTALHVRVRLKDEAMPPIVQRCVDDLVRGLLRSGLG